MYTPAPTAATPTTPNVTPIAPMPTAWHRQAGIAAIELSLTLIVLLMLVFALVSYGALFWAQQSLTGVAADTARYGLLHSYSQPADPAGGTEAALKKQVMDHACRSAHQTAVLRAFGVPAVCGASDFASNTALAACDSIPAARCLTVTLTLQVNDWPLLNSMRSLAGLLTRLLPGDSSASDWVPDTLQARATVVIAPNPAP